MYDLFPEIKKLWVYYNEPIDFFKGLTRLDEYIKLVRNRNFNANEDYEMESIGSLRYFVIKCLNAAIHIGFDGYLRNKEIYVGALPDFDTNAVKKYLIIKQDNNGTTFIVSTIPYFLFEVKFEEDRKFEWSNDLTNEQIYLTSQDKIIKMFFNGD